MTYHSDSREAVIQAFLKDADWDDATRAPLGQDASTSAL